MLKKIIAALAAAVVVFGTTFVAVPGARNLVGLGDTEVVVDTTEPTASTEATTEATEPTTASTEATEPTTEATEPTEPATEPTTEATEPTEPATEPATEPTEAPVEVLEAFEEFKEFFQFLTGKYSAGEILPAAFSEEGYLNLPPEEVIWGTFPEGFFRPETDEEKSETLTLEVRVNNGLVAGRATDVDADPEATELKDGTIKASWKMCQEQQGKPSEHWHYEQPHNALQGSCISEERGSLQKVSFAVADLEAFEATAIWWIQLNEQGLPKVELGVLLCGEGTKDLGNQGTKPQGGNQGNTKPTEPKPTEPQPTEPQPTEPQPTEPQEIIPPAAVNHYVIRYSFAGQGCSLPSAVTSLCPSSTVVEEGKVAKAPSLATTTVKADGGTYTFIGWSVQQVKVTESVTITGYWSFTKDNTPEHSAKPGEETSPADDGWEVAPDQGKWGGSGSSGNTPEHSTQPAPTEPAPTEPAPTEPSEPDYGLVPPPV